MTSGPKRGSLIPDVANMSITRLMSLEGRVAVVTGGALGLGKATAGRLLEAGADVLIGDLDAAAAQATRTELEAKHGGRIAAFHLDVADPASVATLAARAMADFDGLDIWVNNAGVPTTAELLDVTEEEWDRVMAINFRGVLIGAREAARHMIASERRGVIVNVASLAGQRGYLTQVAYGASKAGVLGLTRQLSVDLARYGIRVLAVSPGFTLTENKMFLADLVEADDQASIPGVVKGSLGRFGVADDIARAVLFCASDLSLFMSGNDLVVDGGVSV